MLDLLVLGAGPAGYVAAIRATQLGMEVAVVEPWINKMGDPALGGVCLNVGCIPSKALLDSSARYAAAQSVLHTHGITAGELSLDVSQMIKRKDQVVSKLTQGIGALFKANRIEWIKGRGQVVAPGQVTVEAADGSMSDWQARYIIIATGSVPIDLPVAKTDGKTIVDSSGALEFDQVPARLAVIGAGIIGLELGSVWSRLGSDTVLLEAMDSFLPIADQQVAREAMKQFTHQGLDIRLGAKVTNTQITNDGVVLSYVDENGDHELEVDKVLVAIGRCAHTHHVASDTLGLKTDIGGVIKVNERFETNIDRVYAIGDCIGGAMLAHKASEEGVALAEQLAGQSPIMDHHLVPSVVYTEPELAWVGESEQDLRQRDAQFKTGTFPFAATGRALATGETAGLVKVMADAKTDRVLGVHILGNHASELIAQAVSVMAFQGSAEDIARTIHAHPTLSEALHEAALDVEKRAIHKAAARSRPSA